MVTYSRRFFLMGLASLAATLRLATARSLCGSPDAENPEALCDVCGAQPVNGAPLSYCIQCNAVLHPDCARRVPCDHSTQPDWQEMFHSAAEEAIETAGEHALILPKIELVA